MTTSILGGILGACSIIVPGIIAVIHDRRYQMKRNYKMINLWEKVLYR